MFFIQRSKDTPYTVEEWQCSCVFSTTRLLPCRHVIIIRKALNLQPLIPLSLIADRWILRNALFNASAEPQEHEQVEIKVESTVQCLPAETKFKRARDLCMDVCEIMSTYGTTMFGEMHKAMQSFKILVEQGQ